MQPEDVGDQVLRGHDGIILHVQLGEDGRPNLNQEVVHHIQLNQGFPQQILNRFNAAWPLFQESSDLFAQGRFEEGWAKLMTGYVILRGFGQQIYVLEHCLMAVGFIFGMSIGIWFFVMEEAFMDTGIFREVAAFLGFFVQSIILLTHLLRHITRFFFR